jgi:hypothetical protein
MGLEPFRHRRGGMMASSFGCDPDVARQVAGQLAEIRSALSSLGAGFDGLRGVTGSAQVETALQHFVSKSSDSRRALDKLLERAVGLLTGLADGTSQVDAGLVTALGPVAASEVVPAASAAPTPAAAAGGGVR